MSNAAITLDDRIAGFEKVRQEIGGRRPQGPFEFSDSLEFDDIEAKDDDPVVVQILTSAIKRDARHASSGPVYLRRLGLSQSLRTIYEGGKAIIEGGGE